jgi:hypothetical protein
MARKSRRPTGCRPSGPGRLRGWQAEPETFEGCGPGLLDLREAPSGCSHGTLYLMGQSKRLRGCDGLHKRGGCSGIISPCAVDLRCGNPLDGSPLGGYSGRVGRVVLGHICRLVQAVGGEKAMTDGLMREYAQV